jgi:hypothetical protein
MGMDIKDGWSDIEFPEHRDIVYILYFVKDAERIPFYIGESSRNVGRFGDYVSANFTAATDFKVGEAIRYLRLHKFEVRITYNDTLQRKKDEEACLRELRGKHRLLNDLPGYNPKKADQAQERFKVHDFMKEIITNLPPSHPTPEPKLKEATSGVGRGTQPHHLLMLEDDGFPSSVPLSEIRLRLAEKWILDPNQRRLYLTHATQFKQWANYIGAVVLTHQGLEAFTRGDIINVLRELMPNHFDRKGATEGGLLTSDMERSSKYSQGLAFLEKVAGTRAYRFIGFQVSPKAKTRR